MEIKETSQKYPIDVDPATINIVSDKKVEGPPVEMLIVHIPKEGDEVIFLRDGTWGKVLKSVDVAKDFPPLLTIELQGGHVLVIWGTQFHNSFSVFPQYNDRVAHRKYLQVGRLTDIDPVVNGAPIIQIKMDDNKRVKICLNRFFSDFVILEREV